MSFTPILETPSFWEKITVKCDASRQGIGVVLIKGIPLDFENEQFKGKYLVKSTYEK